MAGASQQIRQERIDLIKLPAFLVVAGLFTWWVGIVTSASRPGDRQDYKAVFANVSGLTTGDAVRISGVDVGKVTKIQVQPDATVLVTFSVPTTDQLNASTQATVQYSNLIGDRIIQLTRPDPKAAPLAPGSTIPQSRTKSALDLDTLLNGFKPLFAGLSPAQTNALSADLINSLQGQNGALNALLEHAGSFTTAVGERQQLVGQVIRNLNAVAGTFDQHRDQVGALVDQLSGLLDGLKGQDTQVLDAAAQINGFAGTAADLLASLRPNLTPDLTQLGRVAAGLTASQNTLVSVLNKLPQHYAAIQDTASYGNFFNFFLCGVRVETGTDSAPILTPWIMSSQARCTR